MAAVRALRQQIDTDTAALGFVYTVIALDTAVVICGLLWP
ncbi:hypothetical protein LDDCCGHA_0157 [Methylobacterium oxalidis]|nr:hypothetical protein LDDCCGHA_0157 [Methylobacterium oxalidis]